MSESPSVQIIHRDLDTSIEPPSAAVAHEVARIEESELDSVTPAWNELGDLLQHLFDTPPRPGVQAEVRFTYAGYRITVEQDGSAKFVKVE